MNLKIALQQGKTKRKLRESMGLGENTQPGKKDSVLVCDSTL